MKKIIRLSESQLIKIIRESLTEKKIISEQATVLQSGDKGYFVKSMQQNLIKLGYDLGKFKDDGKFGGKTLLAIRKFQEDEGISPISNNADVNLQNKIQNKADGKKESYFSDKNYKNPADINTYPSCVRFRKPTLSKKGGIVSIAGTGFYEGYSFFNNGKYSTKSRNMGTYTCNKKGELILDIAKSSTDKNKIKTKNYQYSPRIDAELQHIKNRKMDDTPFFIYDPRENLIYLFNTGGIYVASSSVIDGADVQKSLSDMKAFTSEDWCKISVDYSTGKKLLTSPHICTNPDTGKYHDPNYGAISALKSRFMPKGIYTIKGLTYNEGYVGGKQGNTYDLKPIKLEGTITAAMEKSISPAIHGIPKGFDDRLRASKDLQDKLREDLNKGKIPAEYINSTKSILYANQSYGCVGIPESFVDDPKVRNIIRSNLNKIKVFAMGEDKENFLVKNDGENKNIA